MTTATQWRMKGSIIGACSCDWGCPCNFDARPTQGLLEAIAEEERPDSRLEESVAGRSARSLPAGATQGRRPGVDGLDGPPVSENSFLCKAGGGPPEQSALRIPASRPDTPSSCQDIERPAAALVQRTCQHSPDYFSSNP